jgi:uncharacterized membrane protein YcaP (DUF421 family)
MENFLSLDIDWGKLLLPDMPLIEIFIRGTAIYLFIFVLLRLVLKRETGTLGIADLLVVVLVADAAQNAMTGTYQSITDGFLLIVTIVFWSYTLDWLGYHFPQLEKLVHPPELLLIKDGKMLRRNMKHELITENELCAILRQHQIEDVAEVKRAYIEGDGEISVIPYKTGDRHRA